MRPLKTKREHRKGPEADLQDRIIEYLESRGWYVKQTHGNMYQSGFPDLFCCHRRYGTRWVEVKLPGFKGSKFTAAQLEDFPKFCSNGAGVWILTEVSQLEYDKLFSKPNWWKYLDVYRSTR
jgi:hypothetical protein